MAQEKTVKDTKEELFLKLGDAQAKADQAEVESMRIADQLKEIGVTKEEIEEHDLDMFPQFDKE